MGLKFPKSVAVRNVPINLLYYLLAPIVIVGFLAKLVLLEEYAERVDLSGDIAFAFWAEGVDNLDRQWAAFLTMVDKPLCANPTHFDYSYSETFTYVNHTCLAPCSGGMWSQDVCANSWELVTQPTQDELFFYTHVTHTEVSAVWEKENSYFLPSSSALAGALSYSYALDQYDTIGRHALEPASASSAEDILTLLLKDDEPLQIVYPAPQIHINVSTILDMANAGHVLDSPRPHSGENQLEGAALPEGPIGRISGIEILLEIRCGLKLKDFDLDIEWNGQVCGLTATVAPTSWVFHEVLTASPGAYRSKRSYHGIRVKMKTAGSVAFLSLTTLLNALIDFLVIIKIPAQICMFVLTVLLGPLSRVYKKVLTEFFDMEEQVCGMMARVSSLRAACSMTMASHSTPGISKQGITNQIVAAADDICGGSIPHAQLQRLAEYNVERMEQSAIHQGFIADLCTSHKGRAVALPISGDPSVVDMPHFLSACNSQDRVRLADVLHLFDTRRARGMLEGLFAPPVLHRFFSTPAALYAHKGDENNVPLELLEPVDSSDMLATPSQEVGKTLATLDARVARIEMRMQSLASNLVQLASYEPRAVGTVLRVDEPPAAGDSDDGSSSNCELVFRPPHQEADQTAAANGMNARKAEFDPLLPRATGDLGSAPTVCDDKVAAASAAFNAAGQLAPPRASAVVADEPALAKIAEELRSECRAARETSASAMYICEQLASQVNDMVERLRGPSAFRQHAQSWQAEREVSPTLEESFAGSQKPGRCKLPEGGAHTDSEVASEANVCEQHAVSPQTTPAAAKAASSNPDAATPAANGQGSSSACTTRFMHDL